MAIVPDVIDIVFYLIIGGIGYSIGHGRGHDKGVDKEGERAYRQGYDEAKSGKPSRFPNED